MSEWPQEQATRILTDKQTNFSATSKDVCWVAMEHHGNILNDACGDLLPVAQSISGQGKEGVLGDVAGVLELDGQLVEGGRDLSTLFL